MRHANCPTWILAIAALLLAGCSHPISREVRGQVSPGTTFAMVSENPSAFLDRQLLLGGVVLTVADAEPGSVMEVMEWRLSRWGEPLYLDDHGRRFLVRSAALLDPAIYQPGTLVTLAGVVLGEETRLLGEQPYAYPVFGLTEIHLWESPFRYGIHNNPDPAYPYFIGEDDDPGRNPYDPGYNPYPYTPQWYRSSTWSR